jgi:hypothetical protein
MPGQVIHLAGLTPEVREWITSGRAELVAEEPESAVIPEQERAVLPKARGRHVSSSRM